MTISPPETTLVIRPVQYRDLEDIASLALLSAQSDLGEGELADQLARTKSWFGLLKFLSCFPNPLQYSFSGFVAELADRGALQGFVQISPFNSSRSTWRVEQVVVESSAIQPDLVTDPKGIGSQLLRHCFQNIWEARTWLLEVNIEAKNILALYRQNGFQPLAQMTYWALTPALLRQLAVNDPDLPNFLPVSNADAQLLYQLDCVS
ncbi:MAG: GNAT family N-acetyltransferase, partial [Microcystaceae cyanobacterium]